jgi:hypothetical protein
MQQAEIEAFLDAQGVFSPPCVVAVCCVGVSPEGPGPLRFLTSCQAASLLETPLASRKYAHRHNLAMHQSVPRTAGRQRGRTAGVATARSLPTAGTAV